MIPPPPPVMMTGRPFPSPFVASEASRAKRRAPRFLVIFAVLARLSRGADCACERFVARIRGCRALGRFDARGGRFPVRRARAAEDDDRRGDVVFLERELGL
jgi:hypothetical protein